MIGDEHVGITVTVDITNSTSMGGPCTIAESSARHHCGETRR
jgi:hypothetical protein